MGDGYSKRGETTECLIKLETSSLEIYFKPGMPPLDTGNYRVTLESCTTVPTDFTFDYHIYNVVKKGAFRTRATFPMMILLKTILMPVLEYACLIWCPNSVGISLLESVQAKFISRFEEFLEPDLEMDMDVCRINYWTQLKTLKPFSLERRGERYMILFLYKIMIKDYPNPGFILHCLDVADRNGIVHLRAPAWVATVRGASFFVKCPKLYNIIPLELHQPQFVDDLS